MNLLQDLENFEWRCHKRAFSLIELLVLFAIISVLAALILPVLSRARQAQEQILTPVVNIVPVKKYEVNGQATTRVDEIEIDGQRYLIFVNAGGGCVSVLKKEVRAEK